MDRRNGGDPLAPPRPPKLLPRVHRPRAPEPTLSGEQQQQQLATTTANNNTISIIPASADFDDYQIHHLTFLPQRPSSLSRNSSNASSSTATANSSSAGSGIGGIGGIGSGTGSSFTRRRPPAPTPLLDNHHQSSINNNNINNNFLSHFQSADPVSTLGQPPASPVTLAQPRPESERLTNEYVDTPLQHATRSQHPAGQQDNGQTTTHHLLPPAPPRTIAHGGGGGGISGLGLGLGLVTTTTTTSQPITQPITKQPTPASQISKEHMHALEELLQQPLAGSQLGQLGGGGIGGGGGLGGISGPIVLGGDPSLLNPIVCPRCGRCRCEQCQSPRPLPQTWVCNKTCLCSAESIIDYASCLCCAKALFYHCARDNDMDCDDGTGTPCVDNPCSCGPYKRTQRWGWLGALSIVLPCLWFYWPMRGCMKLCEKCYGRFAGRGCRCQSGAGGIGSTSSMLPIVPLGVNGANGATVINGAISGINGSQNGGGVTLSQSNGKAMDHGCSAASRILRKGDLTPEKRLLDSSPDY
ncbi:uncharacterized protein Dwil_GK20377 [Drosophila willistoni]|nr:uncharacterized protein Dwil_GK20377 [Drosophila willistoni]